MYIAQKAQIFIHVTLQGSVSLSNQTILEIMVKFSVIAQLIDYSSVKEWFNKDVLYTKMYTIKIYVYMKKIVFNRFWDIAAIMQQDISLILRQTSISNIMQSRNPYI